MKTQIRTLKKVLLFLSALLIFIGLHCQAYAAGSVTLTGAVDCIVPIGSSTGCDGEALTTGVTTSSPVTLELSWSVDVPSSGSTFRVFNIDTTTYGNEMTLTIGDVTITEQDIEDSSYDDPIAYFTDGVLVRFELDWFPNSLPGYPSNDWIISASGNAGTGDTNIQFLLQEQVSTGDWFSGYINFPATEAVPYDINGDGMSDIVIRNSAGTTWKYLMNGSTIDSIAYIADISPAFDIRGVSDLTGDKKADLVLKSDTLEMIWFVDGETSTSSLMAMGLPTEWPVVAVADFDGDNTNDILIQNTTSGVLWMYRVVNGAIVGNGNFVGGLEAGYNVVGAGDINGDGMSDIVIRNSAGTTWKYLMNGPTIDSIAYIGDISPVFDIVGIADLTGDQKADLVLKSDTLEMIWLVDGETSTSSLMAMGLPTEWPVAAVADFDGDNTNDILIQNTTSGVLWMYRVVNGAIVGNGNFVGGLEAGYNVVNPIKPLL